MNYDADAMRSHLVQCTEARHFDVFPYTAVDRGDMSSQTTHIEQLFCTCSMHMMAHSLSALTVNSASTQIVREWDIKLVMKSIKKKKAKCLACLSKIVQE